jgi:hypothetical protein
MVFDEISEGLLLYRLEPSSEKRYKRLARLAPVHDPRVTIALVEAMNNETKSERVMWIASLVVQYHIPPDEKLAPAKFPTFVRLWWENNETEVRLRAKKLPK